MEATPIIIIIIIIEMKLRTDFALLHSTKWDFKQSRAYAYTPWIVSLSCWRPNWSTTNRTHTEIFINLLKLYHLTCHAFYYTVFKDKASCNQEGRHIPVSSAHLKYIPKIFIIFFLIFWSIRLLLWFVCSCVSVCN